MKTVCMVRNQSVYECTLRLTVIHVWKLKRKKRVKLTANRQQIMLESAITLPWLSSCMSRPVRKMI